MQHFLLKRRDFKHGTYSYLYREDGSEVCCFVELPWVSNKPFKSCVPVGEYDLLPHISPKYGKCYALSSPNLGVTVNGPSIRDKCLWHIANVPSELLGCGAPGVKFGFVKGQWGVIQSGLAFKALMKELDGKPARLTIEKE